MQNSVPRIRRLGSIAIDGGVVGAIGFFTFFSIITLNLTGKSHETFLIPVALMLILTMFYASFDLGRKGTAGKRVFGIVHNAQTAGEKRARWIRFSVKWIPALAVCYWAPFSILSELYFSLGPQWIWLDDLGKCLLMVFAALIVLNLIMVCLKWPLIHEQISGATLEYEGQKPVEGRVEPRGFEVIVGNEKEGKR